jgi:hypothetical protein
MEALSALRSEFEQIVEQRIAALSAPRTASRKAVNADDA